MNYKAIEIAKYIVTYCTEKNNPVSNLKLQKMLYYIWIDYYKAKKTELFKDRICAWQLGPVVPEVYYEFCSYAGNSIEKDFSIAIEGNDKEIIDRIIDKLIPRTAASLVESSHEQGKPWDIVYKKGDGDREEIPFELIKLKECA